MIFTHNIYRNLLFRDKPCYTILFVRCPLKCANHIHWQWDHTELMIRFCCLPFTDWFKRNNMDCLFRRRLRKYHRVSQSMERRRSTGIVSTCFSTLLRRGQIYNKYMIGDLLKLESLKSDKYVWQDLITSMFNWQIQSWETTLYYDFSTDYCTRRKEKSVWAQKDSKHSLLKNKG